MLAPGQRPATMVVGSLAWVVSWDFITNELLLTRLSLPDGNADSWVVDKDVEGTGGGLAIDPEGLLWVTFGQRIYRLDQSGAVVQRWELPNSPADAGPTDENLGAGMAEAAIWSADATALLFVRNGDHRLYRFDGESGTVSVSVDLPIATSYITRLAIDTDGSTVVTGALWDGSGYVPAAARVSRDGDIEVLEGTLAVCAGPDGLFALDASGAARLVGDSTILGGVSKPPSNVPFACDSLGNALVSEVAYGMASVHRISSQGEISTLRIPLSSSGQVEGFGGVTPQAWLNPQLVGLIPDGAGGVWLVTESGIATDSPQDPLDYPSLSHAFFPD